MTDEAVPAPRFRRFETVLLVDDGRPRVEGVVVWSDHTRFTAYDQGFKKPPRRWAEWIYSVYLYDREFYYSFRESQLQPTGRFDSEASFLGNGFEVSFDTVPAEDKNIEDGCYRLPRRFWEVFVFIKSDVVELRHQFVTWPSGITGIEFDVPEAAVLDREYVIRAMSDVFAAESFAVVHGPDSLVLK
jgi:hypothetical protein